MHRNEPSSDNVHLSQPGGSWQQASQPPQPPVKPRRGLRPLRLLGRLLGLALAAGILGFGYFYVSNTAFRQAMQGMMAGVDPKSAFGDKDAVTLMVLGKDEDRDNRDQIMKTNARSDTIILARLDFNAKTIQLLSIPRDTRVHIPGTRGYSKINAAHAIGGPDLTARTLQDFIGVTPDTSLVVDYKLLRKVIDDLGGVYVKVDKPLDYDDDWGNLHIHLKPGWQTLNGRDAMGFVRYRHANEGGGDSDIVRIGRQQQLLQAVKARLKEPATWVRIPAVLATVRQEMRGSLTYTQLIALANFARAVPKAQVAMHVLPSHPGRTFVYPDRSAARLLVARLFPNAGDAALPVDAAVPERPRPRRRRHPQAPAPTVAAAPAPARVETVPEPAADAPADPQPPEQPPVIVEPAPDAQPQVTVEAAPDPAPAENEKPKPQPPAPAPGQ